MARIKLKGIPPHLGAGTVIRREAASPQDPDVDVSFVVEEDGCGYADVAEAQARRLTERCAEIALAEESEKD